MQFRTIVDIPRPAFSIAPCEEMLFVGSCFADNIGRRFKDEMFRATVNPFGVMYNPASILHTVERTDVAPRVAVFTLGTNHVYILRETGEIVDNCQKRPHRLFEERELTVEECKDYLLRAVNILRERRPDVKVIITVSPIRYAKYGFHGSQLSKATLLLAADQLIKETTLNRESSIDKELNFSKESSISKESGISKEISFNEEQGGAVVTYFPAYEIVNDELRDYRFYADDMLHPSSLAVEYIWQRMVETFFSDEAKTFLREWAPLKKGFSHRPLNPDGDEYKAFLAKLHAEAEHLKQRYKDMPL
ncbi:MAG: GSCFA domain-containing protein [Prevotella sp.]|nr:GSCFA domain-containing protein [Prevotella sp.]